jgi:pimeloyl-ACP methyl ester carboxylesterase
VDSFSVGSYGKASDDRGELTRLGEEFDVVIRCQHMHARRFGLPDAPLTLAVHGVSLNSKTFDYLGERLGNADVQLVALDLRGRGRSQSTSPGTSAGRTTHATCSQSPTVSGSVNFP